MEHVFFGFCMGAADVVPGVSGGTIAFVLGVYDDLIRSIGMLTNRIFLHTLWNKGPKHALAMIHWKLLVALACGIVLAIITLSRLVEYLLSTMPIFIWSFFFGLIVASFLVLVRRVQSNTKSFFILLLTGTLVGYVIVGLTPIETPTNWWFLVFSGAIAICAMILPGISGSFILVLLGKYAFILQAVNERNIVPLFFVAIGAGLGLIFFTRIISWLLGNYHDQTVSILIGLMVGSIRKIWPWKLVKGTTEYNILPETLFDKTTVAAMLLIALGFVAIWFLEKIHRACSIHSQ
ncbi:hypothetical protein A3D11_03225 [Candidatus Peribacteria bacterium RIFCSPHIGHO2_02_FULL_49_16]|nr:MAG: hypothetical protein A2880_03090 [Candidatus Peribacteria bacterium RIFCSPHIGHO2_01_FULL_49_38]OGJ59329.1 MAG: hypothetical protein A3D11_03225 [Candidatus Peribacteria bacterium RIFCSPHIGHO2_02_FULL_49_16]